MKNNTARRTAVLAAVFLLLSAGLMDAHSKGRPLPEKKIRILILSKNLRELKEGNIPSMEFEFPQGSYTYTPAGRVQLRKLSVSFQNSSFIFNTGHSELHGSSIIIANEKPGSYCKFLAENVPRSYPLPLEISNTGNKAGFVIEEEIRRYAIDSAWAEMGHCDDTSAEALYALAHAIFARAMSVQKGSKHPGAHFCDLTCCQTYRGRCSFGFDDPVTISPEYGDRIFFGSSGGGIILTGKIFGTESTNNDKPLPDVIFSENITLSMTLHPSWKAEIPADELNSILFEAVKKRAGGITYSPMKETMILQTAEGPYRIAPETFRLIINRKKGWSFIKSNNYTVKNENSMFIFTGSGLGHCAGMSIEGAVQLAKMGYSRYEILEHYYPWIKYNTAGKELSRCYFRYVLFDTGSGRITSGSTSASFLNRRIPFGSVSKLLTVLYLATERKDLFHNYRFRCTGRSTDGILPGKCWDTEGHGDMDLHSAIYNSCNLYFASLSGKIDMKEYMAWIKNFSRETGIDINIPHVKNMKEFAALLAGLDFRLTISVRGLVRLAMFFPETACHDTAISSFRSRIGTEEFCVIRDALSQTMIKGTGSHKTGEDSSVNHKGSAALLTWGKTGTVICGTNTHYGYGIFIGGNGKTGIVSVLRKGNGAAAAEYSAEILESEEKKFHSNVEIF